MAITPSDAIQRLIDVVAQLRDPATGCPWDLEQTHASLVPYVLEEAHEVADAIRQGSDAHMKEELGDLLLQVVFHARMAEEDGSFALADVAKSISDKMVERHPHVFGTDEAVSVDDQNRRWEEQKAAERARRGKTGVLDDVATGLPPMLRALKLQKRAARVGFDWPDLDQVVDKLDEETAELQAELAVAEPDMARVMDEVGDLLFVAVNIARKAGIDPETALMGCNSKFEKRFKYIEEQAELNGKSVSDISLSEMETLWQQAKTS